MSAIRLLLVLVAIGFAAPAAQAKDKGPCDGVPESTDAFNVRSRGAVVYVDPGHYVAVVIRQVAADKHLQMMWVANGAVATTIPVGSPAKLALADGTILELASSKESPPISNANGTTIFTQWIVEFPLTTEVLTKLAASPIAAASGDIGGQPIQFPVPAKKAPKLQAAASCLLTD